MENYYKETIENRWNSIPKDSTVDHKLSILSKNLNEWARSKVGELSKKIKVTWRKLNKCLNTEDDSYNEDEIHNLKASHEKLLYQEDNHWKQHWINNWLAAGDWNTSYFNKAATERHKRKILVTDQKEIENIVTSFYSNPFTSQNPSPEDTQMIMKHISPTFTQDMNTKLSLPFSKKEICKALFDLNPSKASGLDGFTAFFFQNAWDIIGDKLP